jgi:hypothetical protein
MEWGMKPGIFFKWKKMGNIYAMVLWSQNPIEVSGTPYM